MRSRRAKGPYEQATVMFEQIIRALETPPIIIGYGFGAMITQILLDRGWGAAGVAIAPAPIKGILRCSTISMVGAVMGDALKDRKVTSLTAAQFHRRYANTLSESESRAAFERYVVPGPIRMLLQTAFATLFHRLRHRLTSVIVRVHRFFWLPPAKTSSRRRR